VERAWVSHWPAMSWKDMAAGFELKVPLEREQLSP
jgi:hypothetical protein